MENTHGLGRIAKIGTDSGENQADSARISVAPRRYSQGAVPSLRPQVCCHGLIQAKVVARFTEQRKPRGQEQRLCVRVHFLAGLQFEFAARKPLQEQLDDAGNVVETNAIDTRLQRLCVLRKLIQYRDRGIQAVAVIHIHGLYHPVLDAGCIEHFQAIGRTAGKLVSQLGVCLGDDVHPAQHELLLGPCKLC